MEVGDVQEQQLLEQHVFVPDVGHVVDLHALERQARGCEAISKSANTKRAYKADSDHFMFW